MTCLKCGRNTEDEHVFCQECLNVMDKYPVKSNTPVHLPQHAFTPSKKPAPRKRTISSEEQVLILRRKLRRSRLIGLILLVTLSLAAALLVRELAGEEIPAIGQNYTIDINRETE